MLKMTTSTIKEYRFKTFRDLLSFYWNNSITNVLERYDSTKKEYVVICEDVGRAKK